MNDYDEYLPALLTEVAEEFGLKVALELAAEMGGQKISVPLKPEKSILKERIGIDLLKFLCKRYGGEQIIIPLGPNKEESERKRFLEQLSLEHSNNEGAKIAGVHRVTISRARKRARWRQDRLIDKEKNQLKLF